MQPSPTALTADPDKRRWSRAEFHQMADLGWFDGQRVELIDGDILVLSPQKFTHFSAVDRVAEVLRAAFGAGWWVRQQAPMGFGAFSEPEPDVSVVTGRREDYTDHPATAALIVEVSDSTLSYDRNRKASLYAAVGITDYWIVNLVDRQVEVYRQPVPDGTQTYGYGYTAKTNHLPPTDVVSLAGVSVAVTSLLG